MSGCVLNIAALEKNAARFAKMCLDVVQKSRSGFQPDSPDAIGTYIDTLQQQDIINGPFL